MIIDLANVGITAREIELVFNPSEIDLEGEMVTLTGSAVLSGEIQRVNEKAFARGIVTTDISLNCTRCLELVAQHLNIPFTVIFVNPGDEDVNPEAELGDEKLDESPLDDGKIDLAELVREQILLAVPEQIFCTEECKGLCAKCGASLNLIDCRCADDEIDPRWAALKNLQ